MGHKAQSNILLPLEAISCFKIFKDLIITAGITVAFGLDGP
jgi:hypothetical protein